MPNSVCAIIGAGEGLGQSLAAAFAAKGHAIALLSRSENGSAAAMASAKRANAGVDVRFFAADATKPETIESGLAEARSALGDVSVLIYNARGGPNWKPPLAVEYDDLREIYEVEVVGAFAAAKAVIPTMIEKGSGNVMFSSATAAFRGSASNPLYAIGKFGLRALSQSLAKAYAKQGLHVTHVRLDCALDVPIVRKLMGDRFDEKLTSSTDDVAQTYVWITEQPRSAWSNEVELRPYTEDWTF